jgi:pimeloyl-ACP methyl ester carboxylesterase
VAVPQRTTLDGLVTWEWPGPPPSTLLMHGIGNYGRYWDLFADAIAGRVRLVAPDARGHGDSAKPTTGYEPADFVSDARVVMTFYDATEPWLIVGHSMGGYHATALTLANPGRVAGLVLVDVGPRSEPTGHGRSRRLSLERPDRFSDADVARAYLLETSPGYSDAVYANRMAWVFRRDGDALVWKSSKEALRQILESTASRSWPEVWGRLGELRVPVLIVRGTRSTSFSAETARQMLATLPHAELIELDSAHNVALEQPRALANAVVDFARVL